MMGQPLLKTIGLLLLIYRRRRRLRLGQLPGLLPQPLNGTLPFHQDSSHFPVVPAVLMTLSSPPQHSARSPALRITSASPAPAGPPKPRPSNQSPSPSLLPGFQPQPIYHPLFIRDIPDSRFTIPCIDFSKCPHPFSETQIQRFLEQKGFERFDQLRTDSELRKVCSYVCWSSISCCGWSCVPCCGWSCVPCL